MQRYMAYLFLLSLLTSCAGTTETVTAIAQAVPYQTATASMTSTIIPPLSGIILPTPTIITYTVVQGDTLTGIAGRFGVTLKALLAANPSVQPEVLPVGTTLIIPAGDILPAESTPTPAQLPVQQRRCWTERIGGLWCFALVQNEYAETLENLSVQFTLLDANGKELDRQTAFGLLNTLPSGQSMPLAVHFSKPLQAEISVRVQVLTAIRLLPGDTRYLPVMLENTLINLDASGRTAQVTGVVILTDAGTANTLWVLATAFDLAGNVIGVRRWESLSALAAGAPVPFNFLVSSVGPAIDRVEFLAEAMP